MSSCAVPSETYLIKSQPSQTRYSCLFCLICVADMVLSVSYFISLQMSQPKAATARKESGKDTRNVGTVEVYRIGPFSQPRP